MLITGSAWVFGAAWGDGVTLWLGVYVLASVIAGSDRRMSSFYLYLSNKYQLMVDL